MVFTSMNFIRLFGVIGLVLFLASCSALQKNDEKTAVEGDKKGQDEAELVTAAEVEIVLLPNPYTAQAVEVPSKAKKGFEEAVKLMTAKNWKAAEVALNELGANFPTLSGPYINLGLVYARQERWEEAENAFKFGLELNPLNIDGYNQYGIVLRQQGKFAAAEGIYLKALEVWPHSPETHKNLGILYDLYMGRFDDAVKHYEMSQKVSAEPSRQLKGWIIDLKRRMKQRAG